MTFRLVNFVSCDYPGCDLVFHGSLRDATIHGWTVYAGGRYTYCTQRGHRRYGFGMRCGSR